MAKLSDLVKEFKGIMSKPLADLKKINLETELDKYVTTEGLGSGGAAFVGALGNYIVAVEAADTMADPDKKNQAMNEAKKEYLESIVGRVIPSGFYKDAATSSDYMKFLRTTLGLDAPSIDHFTIGLSNTYFSAVKKP